MSKKLGLNCVKSKGSNWTAIWLGHNGYWHCVNGPAIVYDCGAEFWYVDNSLHREDGPAYRDNRYEMSMIERYFLNGREYSKEAFDLEIKRRKSNDRQCKI